MVGLVGGWQGSEINHPWNRRGGEGCIFCKSCSVCVVGGGGGEWEEDQNYSTSLHVSEMFKPLGASTPKPPLLFPFYAPPKGEHIVAALSVRPSVHPSHFYPEHISQSIEGNLMKIETLIEGQEENCTMQEP